MPDEQDPSRYRGISEEQIKQLDIKSGKLGIDLNPTFEESEFLKIRKDRFIVSSKDYNENKGGLKQIIDSLLAKGLIKGSLLNDPKSGFFSYEKVKSKL